MPDDDLTGPYHEAIRRGFNFARELGSGCRPVHFLVGISDGDGPAAHALRAGRGRLLREVVAAMPAATNSAAHLHMPVQEAAGSLAEARGQQPSPEHLLVALVDQGDPEVLAALRLAGLDAAAVRVTALAAIGATADEPPLRLATLTPAGALDRPPLPVADLDPRAWAVLSWRQDHLPLHRVRGSSGAQALSHLERDAAWRLADRLKLDDDQRFSLLHHHAAEVGRRLGRPTVAGARRVLGAQPVAVALRRRRARRPAVLKITVGWGAWLGNRRAAMCYRWFRLRTTGDYRGCPQP
jgi:Clp amino terminal domain, pathogenicity island component